MSEPRQTFPPPWTVRETDSAYYLEDAAGHTFGFVYFRDYRLTGTGLEAIQTRDGAARLVRCFARLPELLKPAPNP